MTAVLSHAPARHRIRRNNRTVPRAAARQLLPCTWSLGSLPWT